MVIDIYLAMVDVVWLHEPDGAQAAGTRAQKYSRRDRHAGFCRQGSTEPLYVTHGERMDDISAEDRRLYASVDTGFIGQNVYLLCTSEGHSR